MPHPNNTPQRPPADQDQNRCVHCGVIVYMDDQGMLDHMDVSDCCKALVIVQCGDDGDIGNKQAVTCHYECALCKQPCDLYG